MELTFLQKVVLLALDDKGWFGASEHKIKFGIVAAILFELYKLDRISIENDVVTVTNTHSTDNVLFDRVLNVIKTSAKQRSPRSWIQRIAFKKLVLRKTILKQLINQNVIGREEYSLMVVFYQTKFPLKDVQAKKGLQERFCELVLSGNDLDDHDLMLLVVMNACRMVRKNFGGYLQYLKFRGRINDLLEFRDVSTPSLAVLRQLHISLNRAIMASNVSIHI